MFVWYLFIASLISNIFLIFRLKSKRSQTSLEDTEAILRHIRKHVTAHILNDNARLFSAIAKQKMLLNEKNRNAIAIFISEAELNLMLQDIVTGEPSYIKSLHNSLVDLNVPIGYIGELPIYVSRLLTEAPIFVVGSIRWEL